MHNYIHTNVSIYLVTSSVITVTITVTTAERVDMELSAPDTVERVVSMIESLADKDKLAESYDEDEDTATAAGE